MMNFLCIAMSNKIYYFKRNFQTSSEDSINQKKSTVFYNNNRPVTPKKPSTSPAANSKYSQSISHSAKPNIRQQHVLSKSLSNIGQLKTYPEAFTILPSNCVKNIKKNETLIPREIIRQYTKDLEDDDEMMQMDWLRPPPEKLLEASKIIIR